MFKKQPYKNMMDMAKTTLALRTTLVENWKLPTIALCLCSVHQGELTRETVTIVFFKPAIHGWQTRAVWPTQLWNFSIWEGENLFREGSQNFPMQSAGDLFLRYWWCSRYLMFVKRCVDCVFTCWKMWRWISHRLVLMRIKFWCMNC